MLAMPIAVEGVRQMRTPRDDGSWDLDPPLCGGQDLVHVGACRARALRPLPC